MRTQDPISDIPLWSDTHKIMFGFLLFLAAAVHGFLILAVHFQWPSPPPPAQTLDITLSRYQDSAAPEDAKFLAQSNQQGSGSTKAHKAPSTSQAAPMSSDKVQRQSARAEDAPQKAETEAVVRQTPVDTDKVSDTSADTKAKPKPQVVTSTKAKEKRPDTLTENPRATTAAPKSGTSTALLAQSLEVANLQAQRKLVDEDQSNADRVLRFTSASTLKYSDAAYLDNWRQRVENTGNENYPEEARRRHIWGKLRLMVSIRPDGSVKNIQILKSSGHPILDKAAIRIVQLSAPFQPFTPDMRKRADQLDIVRTWKFEKEASLY